MTDKNLKELLRKDTERKEAFSIWIPKEHKDKYRYLMETKDLGTKFVDIIRSEITKTIDEVYDYVGSNSNNPL